MKNSISLTITIPAYNEAGSIYSVITQSIAAAKKITKDFEILVVDDGSTDITGSIADKLAKKDLHVKVIHHTKNQGFSGAITSCYTHATKDFVFLIPADGQVAPLDCIRFIKKIDAADVVVGYRIHNPEPFSRKLNSWVFHRIYRILFGVPLKEISTCILWRKSVLAKINISAAPRSALIQPEVIYKAWKAGFRFIEVPVPYYARRAGVAKGNNPMMIYMTIKEITRLWIQERILPNT